MYLLHNRAINHIQHFWQMKKKEFSQTKFEATTHHHHFVHMQKKQMEESQILKSNCKTDIILMHHNKKLVSMNLRFNQQLHISPTDFHIHYTHLPSLYHTFHLLYQSLYDHSS